MSHTSFLGIPIEGVIIRGDVRAEQRPLADFEPLVRALLEDQSIVEFGWRQATPYFSDGDPCIFSAYGFWVRTTADSPSDPSECDDRDSLEVNSHPTLGHIQWVYFGDQIPRERRVGSYTGPDQGRLERCIELSNAIESGQFDDVLLEAFGDHAYVTVAREGISIELYEHE